MTVTDSWIWVFNGPNSPLPSACFGSKSQAEEWIRDNRATGILTKMPVGTSVYHWAIDNGYFEPKGPHQTGPKFVSNFTSAYLEHYHYERGE